MYSLAILALGLGLLLAACAPRDAAPDGRRLFTDELGRQVRIAPSPQRIISLAPSVTEMLFAIGLGDRVAGVTSYCDFPPEAAAKEKIGDTLRPNLERIIALKPDLVIASTSSQLEQFVRTLDELGVPIYVSNPRDLMGVLASIENIGAITGTEAEAAALRDALRQRIAAVEERVAGKGRPRVLLILGVEPLITAGGTSFLTDMVRRAGGESVAASEASDYPQYSLETAVARQPEVIFLQGGETRLPERLQETPAARSGRVYRVNDDLLMRPGPRIVDGLEELAVKIHPEAFAATGK